MAIMTTTLDQGWNMASVHCDVNLDVITEVPEGLIAGNIYEFNGDIYVQISQLMTNKGYWIRTNNPAGGYFTYECPDVGDDALYIFPSLWVRGDGDAAHIPPWRVNYIAYTFPIPVSINSLFPSSWYESDPDVGEASPGVLTSQDVIYTDFWNYTTDGQIVENKPSSYYDGAEWVPNIILQPGRGYVLKTRLNGYVKWTLN